jgi:predicted nucleic acid-binding protein
MKKTELFNNISPELINQTKLKPGEQVVYRVSGIQPHPWEPGKFAIPAAKNVPITDEIYDPIKEEYVSIAAVKSVNPDGSHLFHDIYFFASQGGHLILVGGRASDQEIHTYLTLCNYNGSNPKRDESKEILFEFVDEAAKSEKESKQRNIKREALNLAVDLTAEEVRNYIAALGQDDTDKLEVLRNKLEALADNDPQSFLDLIGNKQALMKATINRAIKKSVIVFDAEQARFAWPNGEAILTVSRTTGSDHIEELISYCVSSPKGEKVYQTLQSKSKK